jgi:hypothetical protein
MKPTLKAPRTKLLELQYDEVLSSVAFNLNLRRYNVDIGAPLMLTMLINTVVKRCRFIVSKGVLKAPMASVPETSISINFCRLLLSIKS